MQLTAIVIAILKAIIMSLFTLVLLVPIVLTVLTLHEKQLYRPLALYLIRIIYGLAFYTSPIIVGFISLITILFFVYSGEIRVWCGSVVSLLCYVVIALLIGFVIAWADQFVMRAMSPGYTDMSTALSAGRATMMQSVVGGEVAIRAPSVECAGTMRELYCNAALVRSGLYSEKEARAVERTIEVDKKDDGGDEAWRVAQTCIVNATRPLQSSSGTATAQQLTRIMKSAGYALGNWRYQRANVMDKIDIDATAVTNDPASFFQRILCRLEKVVLPRFFHPDGQYRSWSTFVEAHAHISHSHPLLWAYSSLRHYILRPFPLVAWPATHFDTSPCHGHYTRTTLIQLLNVTSNYTAEMLSSYATRHNTTTLANLDRGLTALGDPIAQQLVQHGIREKLSDCAEQDNCFPSPAAQVLLEWIQPGVEEVQEQLQRWLLAGAPVGAWSEKEKREWNKCLRKIRNDIGEKLLEAPEDD